jgi:hypothetical protein
MELLPVLWIKKYQIKTEVGLPIDFTKRKFLIDIYNDFSPFQAWLKPPQIGATVCNTLKAFYIAKKYNRQIIYTLPTQGDVQDMVGGSINRIIAQNPVLMEWVKDHDTVEQKQVGEAMIFYRGTFTAKQAMMIPSGLNIHDEVDASDPDIITQYENRLQAQEDGGWRWYFSHPSIVGFGVDIYWQQSDKKEWFIKCPHCKKEVCLASQDNPWKDSIDFDKQVYVCRLCKGELKNEDRNEGYWKPTAQGLFSGYHVSQLMLYNKSARDIIKASKDPLKDEQFFYNYVLGLPFLGSENKISSEIVLKNVRPEVNTQANRIIIGVDTGMPWHITCMNTEGVFYWEKLKNVGEQGTTADYDPKNRVRELLKRWPTSIVIGDQGGELSPLRILQQEFPGRVFLCYYRKDRKSLETITWGEDEKYGQVTVDRNVMFQVMVEQLRDLNRITLNGSREDWLEWASHFDNVYREIKVAKSSPGKDVATNYGVELIWKRNGADHFCHTLLYCLVGMDRFSQGLAKIISKKDNFLAGVVRGSSVDGTIPARQFKSFYSTGSDNNDF